MGESDCRYVITRDKYDAVLLDLDGVVTDTANLHAACWKQMFDEYLLKRATMPGEALRLFDLDTDYRVYIDGKPRFDGVRDFLASRKIRLPEGSSEELATNGICVRPRKPQERVGQQDDLRRGGRGLRRKH